MAWMASGPAGVAAKFGTGILAMCMAFDLTGCSGVQDAGMASGGVGVFCQRCGLGYGDKERRGGWGYSG